MADTCNYNADFDGDEMQAFVPQSPAARADVMTLMSTEQKIVSKQNNQPIFDTSQDAAVAPYLFTFLPDTEVDFLVPWADLMDVCVYINKDFSDMLKRAKPYYPKYITKDGRYNRKLWDVLEN